MKFDMGGDTLATLTKQTDGSQQDLGALVRQLVDAAAPLEGKFSGAGKARFDEFKMRSDEIADDLNRALASIVGGQDGMNTAFVTGDMEAGDNATQAMGSANFDGARFSSTRA
ncbi:hypothetical protein [Nocardioides sp. CFH 31398]|uniref:hypothetical protein n=1 Tax=Nocardioides sp. CFH 31398 TaxID=2919579 RepID=UPI001F054539|nr:hypothetical protein [Nocardioides sp. CFH 31398]MCH1865814.1 hypothetical protein [Nocardioides sp. CFH 31398]